MIPLAPADCRGRTRLLILQSTPFCNIDCSYCYLPARDDRRRMAFETVEASLRLIFENDLAAPDFTVLWHAGEPLAVPVDWYQTAFAAAARGAPAGTHLRHAMQTNALLIDPRWCDFFREHGVRVGVSLDGPQVLHDARRRTRAGAGTHARVMAGIDVLRRHGVPFHVICVIGADMLDAADEVADFFIAHDILDVGFNVEEVEGANVRSSLDVPDVERRFADFFSRLIARADAARPPLRIREREEVLRALRHPRFGRLERNPQNEPLGLLSVTAGGEVYTFSPELAGVRHPVIGDLAIGTLPGDRLAAMLSGDAFAQQWAEIEAGRRMCRRTCAYFDLCLGGAPVNKLSERGTFASDETLYCRLAHRAVADAVLGALEGNVQASAAE